VFRSSQHIYAQVIDDTRGHTLAAASSLDKDLREKLKETAPTPARPRKSAASWRSGPRRRRRSGRVRSRRLHLSWPGESLAEAAREGGLQF
jgi:large subunit ribosomal protein L18